jgi:hypothetical protein
MGAVAVVAILLCAALGLVWRRRDREARRRKPDPDGSSGGTFEDSSGGASDSSGECGAGDGGD